jgi:hypothetical protein
MAYLSQFSFFITSSPVSMLHELAASAPSIKGTYECDLTFFLTSVDKRNP